MNPAKFNVKLPVMPGNLGASPRGTRTEKVEETHEVNGKVFHTVHFAHFGAALPLAEDFAFRIKAKLEEVAKNPAPCNERIVAAMDKRGVIDFRNADLSGADFSGAFLAHARFDGADLRGADFRGADLNRVIFAGADLREADFRGADCARVDVSGANLALADFRGAKNVSSMSFQSFFGGDISDTSLTIFDKPLSQLRADVRASLQLKLGLPPDSLGK